GPVPAARGLARAAEAVRRAGPGREDAAGARQVRAGDPVGAGPQSARPRLLRPPGPRQRGRRVPEVPRPGRDDGARAAGRGSVDGLVRELPPGGQPNRRVGQEGPRLDGLLGVPLLSRGKPTGCNPWAWGEAQWLTKAPNATG